jgi:hypothetical protein
MSMQIVQGDEVPCDTEASNVRAGTLKKWPFVVGEAGTAGNFKLGLFQQTGDFYSPRHRHNFDQFRFQIEGECDFDRNGKMRPGALGYFPEGAYYGPQSSKGANLVIVVQFGGPSGSGYLSQRQVDAAYEEMKQFGTFDRGVYRRNEGVAGKKNLDSFQAVWEYANKRPLVYPKPQYAEPILINPDAFRWQPLAGASGVDEKAFGTFTDCNIRCSRYRLSPGSRFIATGRGLFLALCGAGSVEGLPLRRYTATYLKDGEQATFSAEQTAEILLLGLPDESRIGTLPMIADDSQDSAAA